MATQWKLEEYSQWSRQLAKNYTIDELKKKMNKCNYKTASLAESHLNAINKTNSMIGNSWRRSQSRNSMVSNYEEYRALKDAIEIKENFNL